VSKRARAKALLEQRKHLPGSWGPGEGTPVLLRTRQELWLRLGRAEETEVILQCVS